MNSERRISVDHLRFCKLCEKAATLNNCFVNKLTRSLDKVTTTCENWKDLSQSEESCEFFDSEDCETYLKPNGSNDKSGWKIFHHSECSNQQRSNSHTIGQRNERERDRVRALNEAFARLRKMVPYTAHRTKRVSKVKTLQKAVQYISELETLLMISDRTDGGGGGVSYQRFEFDEL